MRKGTGPAGPLTHYASRITPGGKHMNSGSWRYVVGVAVVLGIGGGILYAARAKNPDEGQAVTAAQGASASPATQAPAPQASAPQTSATQALPPAAQAPGGPGERRTTDPARPQGPAAAAAQ